MLTIKDATSGARAVLTSASRVLRRVAPSIRGAQEKPVGAEYTLLCASVVSDPGNEDSYRIVYSPEGSARDSTAGPTGPSRRSSGRGVPV